MEGAARRFIIYGQVCLYIGLLLCVLIRPQGLSANQGISYYGVYKTTILPYILALLGGAYFSIKAADSLVALGTRLLRYGLTAIGLLTIGVMITPDTLSHFVDSLHVACGAALFIIELILSVWLIFNLQKKRWVIVLTALELASGIAAFIYLAPPHGLLLESQIVFQMAFGGLMVYTLSHELAAVRL